MDRNSSAPTMEAVVGAIRTAASFHSLVCYPFYIASRIKKSLRAAQSEPEQIIASVGDIETIGDGRYALTVTDHNGNGYLISVEIASRSIVDTQIERPGTNEVDC